MKNVIVPDIHPDQRYIAALVNNNADLLDELYRNSSGMIKQLVVQNNGSETDAADIFQNALLSVYSKAKNENFVLTCSMSTFLYTICKRRWINELKKRKIRSEAFLDVPGFGNTSEENAELSEACIIQQDRRKLLEEKLEELKGICKQLLQLSWSGKTMPEVAKLLHISYAYARKKKTKCKANLIKLVKQSPQFNSLKW